MDVSITQQSLVEIISLMIVVGGALWAFSRTTQRLASSLEHLTEAVTELKQLVQRVNDRQSADGDRLTRLEEWRAGFHR